MQDFGLGPEFGGPRHLFPVLAHVVNELKPEGFALEFGVAEGNSLKVIAAGMPAVGFDWWKGLPEAWGTYAAGSRACPKPEPPENATLVEGLFADSLPVFDFGAVSPIGLVHFDADLYSSTVTILEHVGPHLKTGCFLVFDEWRGMPWYAEHEQRAFREWVEATGVTWTVVGHDDEAWAIRLEG